MEETDAKDVQPQQQPNSPHRQPLDCIPVETVLHEQSTPESSFMASECFEQVSPSENASYKSSGQAKSEFCFIFFTFLYQDVTVGT